MDRESRIAELNRKEPVPLRRGDVDDMVDDVCKITQNFVNMISNPCVELFSKKDVRVIERYIDKYVGKAVPFNYSWHVVKASSPWLKIDKAGGADFFNLTVNIAEEGITYDDEDVNIGFVVRISPQYQGNGNAYNYQVKPVYVWYD